MPALNNMAESKRKGIEQRLFSVMIYWLIRTKTAAVAAATTEN